MKKNLITTALLATLPTLVLAQTEQTEKLDEVTVYSAYAAPINQDKTASSVTVLTEKDFAARNATYVSDVLKTVPSLAVTSSGGRGALTNLRLRGAETNHTAVIIDGVRVNSVSDNIFDFGGLSLSNIERIEILRGEQSALWGSDAMGGVIYITTKKGLYQNKPFNIEFDLGVGSHNTKDSSVTISGYNNGFYYALNGNSHHTKGISAFSKNLFSYNRKTGAKGASESDKFHRDGGSITLGYDTNDKGIEIFASHTSQTVHFDNDNFQHTDTELLNDDLTRTRENIIKINGYVGNNNSLFKHKISASQIKTRAYTNQWNAWAYPIPEAQSSSFDAKKRNANYQLDINFDRDGTVTQAVSLLAEYQKSDYQSTNYSSKKSLIEKSIAMEYRLFTEDDHSLSLSGRYFDHSQYQNAFTGRISGAYRLSPNFRLHASYGSAIQNPTMIEYYGWLGNYLPNPNLKAEKSRGGDIGLLIGTQDKKHSLDLTYFARNINNFINGFVNPAINIDGTTKVKGVELVYNGKLNDSVSIYANYTYTNTKKSDGKQLVRSPKHLANAGVSYQITDKLGSNINISYVGKRSDNFYYNATYPVVLPSYTLVGLGANYQVTKNLNIYANLNNLFDKKYENIAGYGQPGRNVYVGLKGSF